MTYRLDVVPRRQTSMYSCWWAATQMLLEYHTNRLPTTPWAVDPAFLPPFRPMGAPTGPVLGMRPIPGTPPGRLPRGCTLAERAEADRHLQGILQGCMSVRGYFIEPHHWYHRGVPVNVPHLALWGYLMGMDATYPGIASSQRDGWQTRVDPSRVENMLRSSGPLIAIRRRPEGGHHAIVITGIVWDQTLPPEFRMVDIIDPAEGRRTISLSRLQQWVTPELGHRNVLSKRGGLRSTPRELDT